MEQLNKRSKYIIESMWALMLLVLGTYVFYILYNAEWQLGDDAYMLKRTAWGIPFHLSESICLEDGFFRPFHYSHENIILLFHSGMHSAFEHYLINAMSFVLCIGALIGILWKTIRPQTIIDHAIIVFGTILVASRLIGVFINIFNPIYVLYTSHALAILFLCIFIEKDKTWAMVLSLLCWVYSMLTYENVCIVLGCVGLFPLIFVYKRLTKNQRIYCFSLLGCVLAFIVAYIIIIYLPTRGQTHYDPSHNTGVSLFQNAKNMLLGQKFILLAAIVWIWRQFQLIRRTSSYHIIYDTLLWAAGGMVAGAIVLGLNWTQYYYDAIIISLPAVVYFIYNSSEKHGKYITLSVMILFATLHTFNVPKTIAYNQSEKIKTATNMRMISDKVKDGWSIIWYEGKQLDEVTEIYKKWRKDCAKPYMQYLLQSKDWDFDRELSGNSIVFINIENYQQGDMPALCSDIERHEITSGISYFIIE